MRSPRAHTLIAATLLLSACGGADEEPSLRDALDALPRDTASVEVPSPVAVDTVGVQVDTPAVPLDSAAADSTSAPWQPPIPAPSDVRPWVPERELDASAGQPGEWTTGIVARRRRASPMTVQSAIRTARHPEYDRVVLELAGDVVPGYHVEYVDRPVRQCGSGDATQVAGDGWLAITLHNARAHTDQGRATVQQRERALSLPVLREWEFTCDFEAEVQIVLGVASPNRYRVLELANPSRLVIDIQH